LTDIHTAKAAPAVDENLIFRIVAHAASGATKDENIYFLE
jgi:hypothetical protein